MRAVIELRDTPCLCGSTEYNLIIEGHKNTSLGIGEDFKIIKCKKCGLARTYPIPYGGHHMRYDNYELCAGHVTDQTVTRKDLFLSFASEPLEVVERYKKSGRLLDLGCGIGILLVLARNKGWETYGADLSKPCCDYIHKELGLNAINSDLIGAKFPDEYFDAITVNQGLEHFFNPLEVLIEINRILKKEGIMVMNSPNCNNLLAKIQKERWWQWLPYIHVWQFTPATARALMVKAGLRPVKTIIRSRWFLERLINIGRYSSTISKMVRLAIGPAFYFIARTGLVGDTMYIAVTKDNKIAGSK
jgi:ubiquinone/menaquinone biosynthesis C-methylase UbiE